MKILDCGGLISPPKKRKPASRVAERWIALVDHGMFKRITLTLHMRDMINETESDSPSVHLRFSFALA